MLALFFLFCVPALAALSDQLGSLAICAQACITEEISAVGCSPANFPCACAKPNFIALTHGCLTSSCANNRVQPALDALAAICVVYTSTTTASSTITTTTSSTSPTMTSVTSTSSADSTLVSPTPVPLPYGAQPRPSLGSFGSSNCSSYGNQTYSDPYIPSIAAKSAFASSLAIGTVLGVWLVS